MQQHIKELENENHKMRESLDQVEMSHKHSMDQMVVQMAVVMDALLTLTKEETQEFAKGMLASGFASLASNNGQKLNIEEVWRKSNRKGNVS